MSGNGNDGTVYGATLGTDRYGSANRAYSFDGVNDYVDVGTLGDFASKMGVSTISFWIRTADSADDVKALMGLIDDTTANSHDPVFKIELNRKMPLNGLSSSRDDTLFYVRDDGGKVFGTYTSQDIYDNRWRQITWVNQNITNHSTALFIDGQPVVWTGNGLDGSSGYPSSFPQQWGRSFVIGAENNRGTIDSFANAEIDDVRIYDRALSVAEVSTLYNLEKPPLDLTTGLVAWYPFDGNASDMSGNGNEGTVYGATLGEDRNGEAGKAYQFDGVNDWIEVENDESFNFDWNDSFTISAWVKPYQLSNNYSKSIIEKWSESGVSFLLRI